jgi:hypothetical protein
MINFVQMKKLKYLIDKYSMESLQIYLSSMSADVYYNNNNNWCEFDIPLIECDYSDHLYLSVQSVSIPYSFYNVSEYNNILMYSTVTTTYTIVIPTGNYNITTLLLALQSLMTTFTITYDKIKNKMTFSNSVDFTFLVVSTCYELIGMSMINQLSVSQQLTSDFVCNMSSVRHLCLATNFTTSNVNKALPNERNILAHIPVSVAPNEVITYANHGQYKCNLFSNNMDHIVIRILDHKGNLIDLNGAEWSITLQIDIINYSNG